MKLHIQKFDLRERLDISDLTPKKRKSRNTRKWSDSQWIALALILFIFAILFGAAWPVLEELVKMGVF